MSPEISEFSYGFALTNELVGWAALKVAPIFPSLIEEGRLGGGYDVKLSYPGVPLFLQFKRAECMVRGSGKLSCLSPPFRAPYYRFSVTERKRSSQHTYLFTLDRGRNQVFYAAPRFHLLEEIDDAWMSQRVAARSIFVPPQAIGPITDDKRHAVSYNVNDAYFCSNPRSINALDIEELRKRVATSLSTTTDTVAKSVSGWLVDIKSAAETAEQIQEEIEEGWRPQQESADLILPPDVSGGLESLPAFSLKERRELEGVQRLLHDISDLARVRFNAQFYVVQSSEPGAG